MSIINKQLKSVTQRNAKTKKKPALERAQKSRINLLMAFGALLFCLLLLGVLWIYQAKKKMQQLEKQSPAAVEVSKPQENKTPEAAKQERVEEKKPDAIIGEKKGPEPEKISEAQKAPEPQHEEITIEEESTVAPEKQEKPEPKKQPKRKRRRVVEKPVEEQGLPNEESGSDMASQISKNNTEALEDYERGLGFIERGHYQKGISFLEKPHVEEATKGVSNIALAKAYLKLEKRKNAIALLSVARSKYPSIQGDTSFLLGHIYWQEGNYRKCVETLMQKLPKVEENPSYYALLAQGYLKMEKPHPAIKVYGKLLEHNSMNGQWWMGMGMAYQMAKKLDLAKDAYEKAARYEKSNPRLVELAQLKVREIEEALQTAEEA